MDTEQEKLVTLQIAVTPQLHRQIAVRAAELGMTRHAYLLGNIVFCLASKSYGEHVRRVYLNATD